MSTSSDDRPDSGSQPAPGRIPHGASLIVSSSTLLARGVTLLLVSFVLAVVMAGMNDGDARTRVVVGWAEQAAFWLGLICIAGDVFSEVLAKRKP